MIQETAISTILIVLVLLLLNPLHFWMPSAMVMAIIAGLIIVFALFAVFVWKERAGDERDELHRMFAGRLAFLAGTGVLVAAIALQSLQHAVDPWLIVTLAVMILAKIAGLAYSQWKK